MNLGVYVSPAGIVNQVYFIGRIWATEVLTFVENTKFNGKILGKSIDTAPARGDNELYISNGEKYVLYF